MNDNEIMIDNATSSQTPHLHLFFLILKSATLILIILLAIFSNLLVILSVILYRRLRHINNYFLVSLAVADLSVAVFAMTFNATVEITGKWNFGPLMCDFWNAIDVHTCTVSTLHLCAISMDRFYAIVKPFEYQSTINVRVAAAMIGLAWVVPTFISFVPIFLGWYTTDDHLVYRTNHIDECRFVVNKPYAIISSTLTFWAPVLIMVTLYYRIYVVARRHKRSHSVPSCNSLSMNQVPLVRRPISTIDRSSLTQLRPHSEASLRLMVPTPRSSLSHSEAVRSLSMLDLATNRDDQTMLNHYFRSSNGKRGKGRRRSLEVTSSRDMQFLLETKLQKSTTANGIIKANGITISNGITIANGITTTNGITAANGISTKTDITENGRDIGTCPNDRAQKDKRKKPSRADSSRQLYCKQLKKFGKSVSSRLHLGIRSRKIERALKNSWRKEHKAFVTLGVVMGAFLACWLPFFTWYLTTTICGDISCPCPQVVVSILFWIGYFNSTLNPVIYVMTNRDFKLAFTCILRRCCCIKSSFPRSSSNWSHSATTLGHSVIR